MKTKRPGEEVEKRISAAREGLRQRGFRCLSGGKFGLPSYTHVEAYGCGRVVVYLVFDSADGGWDLLSQIDTSNNIDETWKRLAELVKADAE